MKNVVIVAADPRANPEEQPIWPRYRRPSRTAGGFCSDNACPRDDRRLFSRNNGRGIDLNIYSLQESRHLNISKLWQALNLNAAAQHGQTQDLLTITQVDDDPRLTLLKDLHQLFLNAKTLGSLISVPTEKVTAIEELYTTILELSKSGDSMQRPESKNYCRCLHKPDYWLNAMMR